MRSDVDVLLMDGLLIVKSACFSFSSELDMVCVVDVGEFDRSSTDGDGKCWTAVVMVGRLFGL